jgi:hypothetical protein
MLDHLNSVSVAASLPHFVTLTLPDSEFNDSVTESAKSIKCHLDNFFKRLDRANPDASGFWRVEWMARKSGVHEGKLMPHAHLLVWGIPERVGGYGRYGQPIHEGFVRIEEKQTWLVLESDLIEGLNGKRFEDYGAGEDWLRSVKLGRGEMATLRREVGGVVGVVGKSRSVGRFQDLRDLNLLRETGSPLPDSDCMSFFDWCSMAWYHVVDSHNPDHFLAGARVERVRSWGGVMSYCSKYMAKLGEDNGFLSNVPIGRSWGIFNRSKIPWAKIVELDLDEETGVRLRRIARRYLEKVRGHRIRAPYGITLYCDVERFKACWARPPDIPF